MLISFWKSPPCLKNFVKLQNHELISRNVQKVDYPMLQFHEIFNVKKCNNINAKFVLLILVSTQRIKSKFFEKFYHVQKMLVLAFEALISDSISTNNSRNCTFFEYSAAWCWHSASSFRVYFITDVTANIIIINFELILLVVVLPCCFIILCQIGLKKKKYQKLKKFFEFYLTTVLLKNYPIPLKYYSYVLYHKNNENFRSKKIFSRDYDQQQMLCCISIVKYDHSCSSNHVQINNNTKFRISELIKSRIILKKRVNYRKNFVLVRVQFCDTNSFFSTKE